MIFAVVRCVNTGRGGRLPGVEPPTIAELVGQRVRDIRQKSGRSQDELAQAARRVGLDWTRAAVAGLETGRRGLSVEEFLLLPLALREVDGQDHALAELLQGGGRMVRTERGGVSAGFLRRVVSGGDTAAMPRRQRLGRHPTEDVIADEAVREAERHAAKVLGVSPEEVARAAHARWGWGLTEQRDIRMVKAPSKGSPRAVRGHVTRELLEELRADLKRGEDDDG